MPDEGDVGELKSSFFNPYKNNIRRTYAYQALYTIWQYYVHLQLNKPFPDDVQMLEDWTKLSLWEKRVIIAEWDLTLLARTVIFHSEGDYQSEYKLETYSYLSKTVKKQKALEEQIAKMYYKGEVVRNELQRIAYREFPHQLELITPHDYIREYETFDTPEIRAMIEHVIGLSFDFIYRIGSSLYLNVYRNVFSLNSNFRNETNGIRQKDIQTFFKHFGSTIDEFRSNYQEANVDQNFVYNFNPLKEKPLVMLHHNGEDFICCPIPDFLYWRFTSGIYYDLLKHSSTLERLGFGNIGNLLGASFQKVIGEVIQGINTGLELLPETNYFHDNRKDTVDWRLVGDDFIVFIECKTKRVSLSSTVELDPESGIQYDLDIIADAVCQIYKTIIEYKEDKYPDISYDENKKIIPVLITFKDWYIIEDLIENLIKEKLSDEGVDTSIVDELPFTLLSPKTLEDLLYLHKVGYPINRVVNERNHSVRNSFFNVFIYNNYGEILKDFNKTGILPIPDFLKL